MQIYLVGGAVRDKLLGLPVKERDWVVVGATVEEMLRLGFRPVGKDFPVFLHPQTHEEYALARTERKTGRGYAGFAFNTSIHVTLEDDLARRDLTINAMAETTDGVLIDPYAGERDLKQKILRHVSPAFVEDPVRVLRVARFAARFGSLGFTVASETQELMKQMVLSGEIDALVAERVWKEWERALIEKNPELFFQTLADCGALSILFPSISMESDGMRALVKVALTTSDADIRFAALLQTLTVEQIKTICNRYRVPSDFRELALLAARLIHAYRRASDLSPVEILDLLQSLDAFRREERFKKGLMVCDASSLISYSDELLHCYALAKSVDVQQIVNAGYSGKDIAERVKKERIAIINKWKMGFA